VGVEDMEVDAHAGWQGSGKPAPLISENRWSSPVKSGAFGVFFKVVFCVLGLIVALSAVHRCFERRCCSESLCVYVYVRGCGYGCGCVVSVNTD
jgi:hypothetical protein